MASEQLRSTQVTVKDTVTNATSTYFIQDNLGPDWASSSAYRGGMSIPGAWRAALLRSGLLAQVPWDAYQKRRGLPEERIEPRPPLLEQPNPPETRVTTLMSTMLDYVWHGNGIWVIAARGRDNWPTAVVPVPAESVGVRRVTEYVDSPLPIGALEYSIGRMRLGSSDLIHFKGPCSPGAVRGMGVLENHMNTLNLAQEQSRQARSITQHGVPTGVLTTTNPDASKQDMIDAKTAWLASQRDRTIAALGPTIDFKPLAWNPEELQMIEARKFTLAELELIFLLPTGWLGGMTSSREYTNKEMSAVELLRFGLGLDIIQFEQTLSLKLPQNTCARADLDMMLRADTLTRFQAHAIALTNRFKTREEVRREEHLPPMPMPMAEEDGYGYGGGL